MTHEITLDRFISNANTYIINPLILLLLAVAVIVFLWGVIEFIAGADNEERRTTGKNHILWGIVGLFIMIGVFGIMNLICDLIGAC